MHVLALTFLMVLLTACQGKEIVRTVREPVFPPSQYLRPCTIYYPDNKVQTVIESLSKGVECERSDKAAIRAWVNSFESPEAKQPNPTRKGGQ